MKKLDLTKYGITGTTELVYNPSYEELFTAETDPKLEGFEKGQVTELGAVNVMTGIYTGRSPKDKFIVMDDTSKDTVWWTSDEFKNDNKPASIEAWNACKKLAMEQLSGKKLYVMDLFCGTNKDSRMAIRFVMEVAWQAHFVKSLKTLSLISLFTTLPRQRLKITRNSDLTLKPQFSLTSLHVSRLFLTPGTAVK